MNPDPRTAELADVIRDMATRLNECTDWSDTANVPERLVRDIAELCRVLSRLVTMHTPAELHAVFGAPGDWGYGTPIGDALKRLYSRPKPARGEGS